MIMNEYEKARDYAFDLLCEQLVYLKQEMAKARMNGDMKAYLSMFRLFLPAQKEYLRLRREQEGDGQTDALLTFANGKGA